MKELPKIYDPKSVEDAIYKRWEESGHFNPDNLKGEPYSIMMPPPNVTGVLHLGHALENSLMDAMARYQRMQGKKVLLVPGTDHAAVATQARVEKNLIKQGMLHPREELGREKLLAEIRKFSEESKSTILKQIRKMGTSCDWSRLTYTFDEKRSNAVNAVFKKMYDDGLIYRGYRVINWSVKGQSTCSDDELEYIERPAKLYTFRYSKDFPIPIATTRPETKLGDTAVAVNPNDERYKQFIGQTFTVDVGAEKPLVIKIIADDHVDSTFGTGALGVTPAHSAVDFEMYEKRKANGNPIDLIEVIGKDGKMTLASGSDYAGLEVEEARKKFVLWLKNNNLLEKEEDITQSIGTSDRFGDVVEALPMTQWFIDVNKKIPAKDKSLKELMRDAVASGHNGDPKQKVIITPDRFEKTYFNWIENLRDWCISRQIWWGHRIPVWYDDENNIHISENQNVLLVRHGETDKNAHGYYGFPQDPLNENGRKQALEAAEKIKSKKIARIISSPFPRALETAKIISEKVGTEVEIWEELREVDEGILAGKKRGVGKLNFEEMAENNTGETPEEMFSRAKKVWKKIEGLGKQGGDVLLVGHRGFHCILSASAKEIIPQNLISYRKTWKLDNSDWEQIQLSLAPTGNNLRQDEDTLDTWFSSGLWTFSTLGWPENTVDLKTFHPSNWMQMGYEILFFWMARMILMTTYTLDTIPFKDAYIHGMLRDKEGHKFSKSRGNGIDPIEVIEKYGCDALRLSLLAGVSPGNDSRFYEEKVEQSRNFVNKLWNISRYIISNQSEELLNKPAYSELTLADCWIDSRIKSITEEVTRDIDSFQFSQAVEKLREFTWNDFADWYVEISKFEENKKVKLWMLDNILEKILKLWHPFIPFVTENIWKEKGCKEMLVVEKWPTHELDDLQGGVGGTNEIGFDLIKEIITAIRNGRLENEIDPKKKIKVSIDVKSQPQYLGQDTKELITSQETIIKNLRTGIEDLKIISDGKKIKNALQRTVAGINIYIHREGLIDVEKEKIKAEKEIANLEKFIAGLEGRLNNEEFVAKAPRNIIDQQADSLAKAQAELAELKKHISQY